MDGAAQLQKNCKQVESDIISSQTLLLSIILATISLIAVLGACLDVSKESSIGLTTAGRKSPTPAMRQEAATTGSCTTNFFSFSMAGISLSLTLSVRACVCGGSFGNFAEAESG